MNYDFRSLLAIEVLVQREVFSIVRAGSFEQTWSGRELSDQKIFLKLSGSKLNCILLLVVKPHCDFGVRFFMGKRISHVRIILSQTNQLRSTIAVRKEHPSLPVV